MELNACIYRMLVGQELTAIIAREEDKTSREKNRKQWRMRNFRECRLMIEE
jgi:hypothetical protein